MRSSFYLFNVNRKQTKRNQSIDDRNLIQAILIVSLTKKLKLATTKQAEKAQNHRQQVLAEAYSTKRLSVQSENPENTKDGQKEPTALNAEQPTEQPAETIHADEHLAVSRKSRDRKKTSQSYKKSQGILYQFFKHLQIVVHSLYQYLPTLFYFFS